MRSLGIDGLRDEGSFGGIVVYNPKVLKLVEEMKFSSSINAIQFLSDFTGQRILVAFKYRVEHWSEDTEDYDPWIAYDQAEAVMQNSGVRPDRTKELAFIAMDDNDDVIGAAFDGVINSKYYGQEYSFDVAVDPKHRGSIGMELIKACLDKANELPERIIRLWVINPKLVRVMERKYGFNIDQQHSDGSAHMSKS